MRDRDMWAQILSLLHESYREKLSNTLSYEEIAKKMGISRHRVVNEIEYLRDKDYVVLRRRQRGARIYNSLRITVSGIDFIEEQASDLQEAGKGITPDLYKELLIKLLSCGPFDSNEELKSVFVDARISVWRISLPEANSPTERVKILIDFLYKKWSQTGENALFLFLCVLSEQIASSDSCHRELAELARDIESSLGRSL